ncbi:hypothetical protein L1049_008200 [Liquidambar formosana]|uniref:DUF7866 domain-containing protein n=1 Tax=Liquidambar formosana TaxID=63359 RepID=A0AAP0S3X3_LIQFO
MDNFATFHTTTLSLLLLLLFNTITPAGSHAVELTPVEPSLGKLRPIGPTEYRMVEGNTADDARRRLAPFQLCLLCKCCATSGAGAAAGPSTTTCATMPCCFGIDCQLPNKPFGVCAFVPKTCNCTSCAA